MFLISYDLYTGSNLQYIQNPFKIIFVKCFLLYTLHFFKSKLDKNKEYVGKRNMNKLRQEHFKAGKIKKNKKWWNKKRLRCLSSEPTSCIRGNHYRKDEMCSGTKYVPATIKSGPGWLKWLLLILIVPENKPLPKFTTFQLQINNFSV